MGHIPDKVVSKLQYHAKTNKTKIIIFASSHSLNGRHKTIEILPTNLSEYYTKAMLFYHMMFSSRIHGLKPLVRNM